MKPKMQLTCPNCGQEGTMTVRDRMFMFYRALMRCRHCDTPLSNPSWFDILRLVGMVITAYAGAYYLQNSLVVLSLVLAYLLVTGLIPLYLLPLQEHWNWHPSDDKPNRRQPKVACPVCGDPKAIYPDQRVGFAGLRSHSCMACGAQLDNPAWVKIIYALSALHLLAGYILGFYSLIEALSWYLMLRLALDYWVSHWIALICHHK